MSNSLAFPRAPAVLTIFSFCVCWRASVVSPDAAKRGMVQRDCYVPCSSQPVEVRRDWEYQAVSTLGKTHVAP